MSGRVVPYLCPYCGDDDLVPYDDPNDEITAGWHCHGCSRVFAVKFHGLSAPQKTPSPFD
ncbi:hypothetical protein [Haloglycomyces albus]|uniref:hypothetical protein n=1 Tax=Haloglycomyces albus TaxID=526067 RepID=UPI00046D6F52|nr:hypothetical protein [Haloglycomyces albus]